MSPRFKLFTDSALANITYLLGGGLQLRHARAHGGRGGVAGALIGGTKQLENGSNYKCN